jgi:hypothetical protein
MLSGESKNRGFHKPPMLSVKARLGGLRNEKNKELGRKKHPLCFQVKARLGGLRNEKNKGLMRVFGASKKLWTLFSSQK